MLAQLVRRDGRSCGRRVLVVAVAAWALGCTPPPTVVEVHGQQGCPDGARCDATVDAVDDGEVADDVPLTPEELEAAVDEPDAEDLAALDPGHPPPGLAGGRAPIMRAVELAPAVFRPGDQLKQNSCSGWATAALATLLRARREGVDPNTIWASPAFLYGRGLSAQSIRTSCTGRLLPSGPSAACNQPAKVEYALNALVREGAAPLSAVPYDGQSCNLDVAAPPEAARYRIGGYDMIKPVRQGRTGPPRGTSGRDAG